jgi:RNase P/RNase MRP subunit p29
MPGISGIRHSFVSEIDDDPEALNNGEICPKAHWNGENGTSHDISGIKGWELIEEKNITVAVNTTTFSNLNGNEDEEYLLELDVIIYASGSDGEIKLLPNNQSTNLASTLTFSSNYNTTVQALSYSYIRIGGAFWGKESDSWSTFRIKAKDGQKRKIDGQLNMVNSDLSHRSVENTMGYWTDISANIISLVLSCNFTFKGNIKLYKKIPL